VPPALVIQVIFVEINFQQTLFQIPHKYALWLDMNVKKIILEIHWIQWRLKKLRPALRSFQRLWRA
jgi:hypothetical protein